MNQREAVRNVPQPPSTTPSVSCTPGKLESSYSRPIRVLHALLAISIMFQLLSTLAMGHPSPRRPMTASGAFYFHWHEWVGLGALAILAVGWLYRMTTWKRESHARLFPWLTRQGLHDLARETKHFLMLRWSTIPEYGALAGTVHGAGILLATAMALTGGAIYLALGPHDAFTPAAGAIMNVHQFMGVFMWTYLCAHSVMALWHQYIGHGTCGRMFRFRRGG